MNKIIHGHEFHDLLKNIFGDVKGYLKSEQIQLNCPKCQERDDLYEPDGKFNLEVNTKKRVFKCWKCDDPSFSGSLGKLIRSYGTHIDYELYKSFAGSFYNYSLQEDEDDFIPIFLPNKFIPFTEIDMTNQEHVNAYNYLVLERGLNFETINKFRLGFCVEGKYAKRIIIPSYDINGNVDYFVARSYFTYNKKPYDNPKYGKKHLIFNERFINYDSLVFLVEGVFEMFILPNSIPLLGKEINEKLFFRLKEKKPDIIIALDPDARKNEIEIYNLLKNAYEDKSHKVRVLGLGGDKDIDEINKIESKNKLIESLYNSKELTDNDYFDLYFNG